MRLTTLKPPLHEERVIKENAFKRVRLLRDADGLRCIGKRFSGHAEEHLLSNANYVHHVLDFFAQRFTDVAVIPQCYGVDEENFEVYIEFLPELPDASLLTLTTLESANRFFETCYAIREKCGVLRGMKHSMYFSDTMKTMIDNGFPLAAGLKGDLWQNLCVYDQQLILADVDSAALEPLGLSEFIMCAELVGAFKVEGLLHQIGFNDIQPVALRFLNPEQAESLTGLALDLYGRRMSHHSEPVKQVKLKVAERALRRACGNYHFAQ